MLNEHICKDAKIKLYLAGEIVEDFADKNSFQLCAGRITNIVSDSEIEARLDDGAFPDLKKNICYMLHIHVSQCVYRCTAYYHSMYTEDNQDYVCLEIVSPLEKIQRRMHQRVSCHSRIAIKVLDKEQIQEILKTQNLQLMKTSVESGDGTEYSMVDISGGGIRFTTKQEIKFRDYLLVRFEILLRNEMITYHIPGQVVYSAPLPNEQESYDVRMKYIGISEAEREQIIQFVFQLERQALQKHQK